MLPFSWAQASRKTFFLFDHNQKQLSFVYEKKLEKYYWYVKKTLSLKQI